MSDKAYPTGDVGVIRFEVIDETGRALTRHNVKVWLSFQDDGKTPKVFLEGRVKPDES